MSEERRNREPAASHAVEDVASWWAEHPQTYGDLHGEDRFDGQEHALGSREFFEEADGRLLEWNHNLHTEAGPFGSLFPYARYAGRRVLEVGCGMGAMASMWAERGAKLTAIDLNAVAIAQTRRRFEVFGLEGEIRQSDGRSLPFADGEFDYAYSWGVLHHSPDLSRSIEELLRVLRPGGEFGVMLYHRHSLLYWYRVLYLEGLLHGERIFLDDLRLASRYTDGERAEGNPHTWPITRAEAHRIFGAHAREVNVRVLGTDIDGILASEIAPVAWRVIPRLLRKSLARRFGWSLWISGVK
jgi:SAM-dependent methyltransferase